MILIELTPDVWVDPDAVLAVETSTVIGQVLVHLDKPGEAVRVDGLSCAEVVRALIVGARQLDGEVVEGRTAAGRTLRVTP